VAETKHLGWGDGGEASRWRIRLYAWDEDQLRKCSVLLKSIVLKDDIDDLGVEFAYLKKYTISNAYNFLLLSNQQNIVDDKQVSWHRDVPLKVNPFVWCLLRKHLLKKDNLTNSAVISATAQPCMENCGNLKDANIFIKLGLLFMIGKASSW